MKNFAQCGSLLLASRAASSFMDTQQWQRLRLDYPEPLLFIFDGLFAWMPTGFDKSLAAGVIELADHAPLTGSQVRIEPRPRIARLRSVLLEPRPPFWSRFLYKFAVIASGTVPQSPQTTSLAFPPHICAMKAGIDAWRKVQKALQRTYIFSAAGDAGSERLRLLDKVYGSGHATDAARCRALRRRLAALT